MNMIAAPFLLALLFGALISGVLWLIFLWPAQEPDDSDAEPPTAPPD